MIPDWLALGPRLTAQQTLDKHFLESIRRAWLDAPQMPPALAFFLGFMLVVVLVAAGILLWRMDPVREWVGRVFTMQRKTLYHILQSEKFVPDHLRLNGESLDLALVRGMRPLVAAKCALVGTVGRLTCESVQEVDLNGLAPGEKVILIFTPVMVGGKRVNAARTTFMGMETRGGRMHIHLKQPEKYMFLSRRAHPRKRVRYQELVQVKLWAAGRASKTNFHELPPDLAVNLEVDDEGAEIKGRVVNVSKGGLGLLVPEEEADGRFPVGAGVVVNLFLFNMREEKFHAYWYAGKVSSNVPDGQGGARLGIQFTHTAQPPEKDHPEMRWQKMED